MVLSISHPFNLSNDAVFEFAGQNSLKSWNARRKPCKTATNRGAWLIFLWQLFTYAFIFTYGWYVVAFLQNLLPAPTVLPSVHELDLFKWVLLCFYMCSVITKPSVDFTAVTNSCPNQPSFIQMFPVSPDSRADALGAHVARRARGCYGTLSNRLLGDCAGPGQVWTLCSQSTPSRSTYTKVIMRNF